MCLFFLPTEWFLVALKYFAKISKFTLWYFHTKKHNVKSVQTQQCQRTAWSLTAVILLYTVHSPSVSWVDMHMHNLLSCWFTHEEDIVEGGYKNCMLGESRYLIKGLLNHLARRIRRNLWKTLFQIKWIPQTFCQFNVLHSPLIYSI